VHLSGCVTVLHVAGFVKLKFNYDLMTVTVHCIALFVGYLWVLPGMTVVRVTK